MALLSPDVYRPAWHLLASEKRSVMMEGEFTYRGGDRVVSHKIIKRKNGKQR